MGDSSNIVLCLPGNLREKYSLVLRFDGRAKKMLVLKLSEPVAERSISVNKWFKNRVSRFGNAWDFLN